MDSYENATSCAFFLLTNELKEKAVQRINYEELSAQ
jgi:hypothetical protein